MLFIIEIKLNFRDNEASDTIFHMKSLRSKQQVIEDRILATHRIIAAKLAENPKLIITKAKNNIFRWKKQQGLDELNWYDLEWLKILDSPVEAIINVLIRSDEYSIHLRSSSPFAGVLSAKERWSIIKNIVD